MNQLKPILRHGSLDLKTPINDAVGVHEETDGERSTKINCNSTPKEAHTFIAPLTHALSEHFVEKTRGKQMKRAQYRQRNDLKLAFSEFYLMLVLLQNFQTLNYTGFRKILKKHDKLFQTTRGEEWR